MRGKIYGIGVGPGDPQLLTLAACRQLCESDVIAVPGERPEEAVSYRIICAALPELSEKECVAVPMPMIRDRRKLEESHRAGVRKLEALADAGKTVAFAVLGDVMLYSSFSFLQPGLKADGYDVVLISGVSSVSAAAARLGVPLAQGDEMLHIIPGGSCTAEELSFRGTCVIMKAAGNLPQIGKRLRESGRRILAVENCGMEREKIYRSADEIPADVGYYSLMIAKEGEI